LAKGGALKTAVRLRALLLQQAEASGIKLESENMEVGDGLS